MRRNAAAAGAIIVCLRGPSAGATELDDQQVLRRLDEARARIEAITAGLTEASLARDHAADALRRAELAGAAHATRLARIRSDIDAQHARLEDLHAEEALLAARIAEQRRALARQVRSAYTLGRQDRLKLLLNQEDPTELARALSFAGYVQRAGAARVRDLAQSLAELDATQTRIRNVAMRLREFEREQRAAGERLDATRAQRAFAVERIAAEIATGGRDLERLRRDEKTLQSLLEQVHREVAKLPVPTEARAPFGTLKGRLPWPARGAVRHRFGTPREGGQLTWQGVVITAPASEAVRVVSHGRVAYADWLRGFGLLVIVDHGEGFMSLYGYNESILKEVGEWVDAGDVVATVGDSGGRREPGLYFEIRRAGTPENPRTWCRNPGDATALVRP